MTLRYLALSDLAVRRLLCRVERIAVADYLSVQQLHDTRRILLGKLRVVSYHYYKAVLRDLLYKLHYLNACLAVQSAGRLVGKQDIRVVDKRSCDGYALHLTA